MKYIKTFENIIEDVLLNEILYFSKNKEELELKLQIKKFNI